MNPILDTIQKRRSVRAYTGEQIREEELTAILEAGRYAPSGGNHQTCHFLVIQNPEILSQLAGLVRDTLRSMTSYEWMYKSLRNAIASAQNDRYNFTYQAPTLIVVANKKHYPNNLADSSCALQNMILAASSLGVGSCWINQLRWLDKNEDIRAYMEIIGLGSDETICGSLSLGYPASEIPAPLERTGNPVTYIR